MKETRAQRNEVCENCGYPFDTGDRCYDVSGEGFPIVCSKRCGESLIDKENRQNWIYSPAN